MSASENAGSEYFHSAIYSGWIRHRRYHDRAQTFRHDHALLWLDLDEVDTLFPASDASFFLRFDRKHYLGPQHLSLRDAVYARVRELRGHAPTGPVRLLTSPTLWGVCFNPVSFYYCYEDDGVSLACVLAEINNTPWNERHTYLVESTHCGKLLVGAFDKAFHVSPFQPMQQRYHWRFTHPSAELRVHMDNTDLASGEKKFDATLVLKRQPLTRQSLRRYARSGWPTSYKTLAAIYLHAATLWFKGAQFHAHPSNRSPL